jgi:nucleoside-triphosphatase THEP1
MMMLNKSVSYFKEKDKVNVAEFESEVLVEPEVKKSFEEYRNEYKHRMDVNIVDEFDVSPTAVKNNQKHMRSIIKLDKNFVLNIHGRHDYVERGFDEEKGMKYYKVYFVNEQ